MLTEKQKKERQLGLGGSDIAAILGLSTYKTPYHLYLEKKGILQGADEETPMQYWGHRLEDLIRDEFARRHNVEIVRLDTVTHPFHDCLRANVDGFIPELNAVFEAKTCNQFAANEWGESGTDVIPMPYLVQVAHYCSVLNANSAHIAVLIGGSDYREYLYVRDLELERTIIEAACEFWDCVQNDIEPPANNLVDLRLMYPNHKPEKSLKIEGEILNYVCTLTETKKKIKELESLEEKYKLHIMKHMQDAECLLNEEGKPVVTWKSNKKGSRTFLVKGI